MANLEFRKFQRRNKIRLFRIATPDKKPGAVVEKKGMTYTVVQTLKNLLGGESDKWKTRLDPATIVTETVEKKYSLRGKTKISKFGIDFGGGLDRASNVKYTISDVRQRRFTSKEWDDIAAELESLHKSRPTRLKRLLNCFVIVFVYYAAEFKIEFDVDVKADIKGQIAQKGSAEVKWEAGSKRVLRVSNNKSVPFGFRGWKISSVIPK